MKRNREELVKKATGKKAHACYVLITCEEATEDGRMQVEMTYEGDTSLAAYLVESAQVMFDEQIVPSD